MKCEKPNGASVFALVVLLVIASAIISGKAGDLEPSAPPGQTMVTLDYLSAQVNAISSPVEKVVRGVITLPSTTGEQAVDSNEQNLPVTVDPNRCVVLLSDSVASEHVSTSASYWEGRTGVCVTAFTTTTIKVRGEGLRSEQKVSYQIIQYK